MIDLKTIKFINNDSKTYLNGSIWKTNKCGNCKIIGLLEKHKNYHLFLVQFEDGTLIKARNTNIKTGSIRNPYSKNVCGVACLGNADSNHPLYEHWKQMINRCYNPKHVSYKNYGDRNIKVCNRWLCFEYFLNDIVNYESYKKLYDGHSFQIDRKDNDKNYCFENCHIVSCKQNARNRRSNFYVDVYKNSQFIERGYITDISKKYNLARTTIHRRIDNKSIIDGIEFRISNKDGDSTLEKRRKN